MSWPTSSRFNCLLCQDDRRFFRNPKLRRSIIVIMSDLSQSANYTDEEAFFAEFGSSELQLTEQTTFAFTEGNREVLVAEYREFECHKVKAFAGKLIGHMLKQLCTLYSRSTMLRVLSSFTHWRNSRGHLGNRNCAVEVLQSVFGVLNCTVVGVQKETARRTIRRWGAFVGFAKKEQEFSRVEQKNKLFYESSVSTHYGQMAALQRERADVEGKLVIQNCRNTRSLQKLRKLKQEIGLAAPELKLKETQENNLQLSGRIETLQDTIAEYIKKTSGVFEQRQKRNSFSHKRNNTRK